VASEQKRTRSFGSVRQLKSGRWQARLPQRLDPLTRPVPGGPFPTEIQARAALEIAIGKLDEGTLVLEAEPRPTPVNQLTVTQVVESYIDDPANNLRPKTKSVYRSSLRSTISKTDSMDKEKWIGQVPVLDLSKAVVAQWERDLITTGMSDAKRMSALRVLSAALSWEAEVGRIPVNPCLGRRKQRTVTGNSMKARDVVHLPTWAEFHTLVSNTPRFEDRLLIAFLGWCGPRFGEAAAIESTDLLDATHEIEITKTWVKPKDEPWQAQPPKNGWPRRIPVPRGLWQHMQSHRDSWTPPSGGRAQTLWRPPTPQILRGGFGLWTPELFAEKVWKDVRAETGLSIKIKDLRAYSASAVVDAGGTEPEAQNLLGHTSPATTRKHYLRAMHSKAHDSARATLRLNPQLSLQDRMDSLWAAWVDKFGDPLVK